MKNNTWVCFDCRESYRRTVSLEIGVKCAKCQNECLNLGYHIPVPRKRDLKAWSRLRNDLAEQGRRLSLGSEIETVRMAHDIEQNEWRLDVISKSSNRDAALKKINRNVKKRSLARRLQT